MPGPREASVSWTVWWTSRLGTLARATVVSLPPRFPRGGGETTGVVVGVAVGRGVLVGFGVGDGRGVSDGDRGGVRVGAGVPAGAGVSVGLSVGWTVGVAVGVEEHDASIRASRGMDRRPRPERSPIRGRHPLVLACSIV
jgi:hypothetical protein